MINFAFTLPTTYRNSAPLTSIEQGTGAGGAVGTIAPSYGLLTGEATAVIPSYAETITITLNPPLGAVGDVQIGDMAYSGSEVVYDPFTGQLTLTPKVAHAVGESVKARGKLKTLPAGAIVPSSLLSDPPGNFLSVWNCDGEVQLGRSLESHPSLSGVSFLAARSQESAIRSALQNGFDAELFGIGFRLSGVEIQRLSGNEGQIRVNLSFTGKWEVPLDEPVKLKGVTSISDVAELAGVPYSGPAISIAVPSDTSADENTTLGAEIETRKRSVLGFAYYSDPGAVRIKSWGETQLHILSIGELLPIDDTAELVKAIDGNGRSWDGVQLAHEYENTEWTPDTSGTGASDGSSDGLRRNYTTELYEGSRDPFEPPAGITLADPEEEGQGVDNNLNFRSSSIWFDQGGVTKQRSFVRRLNGQPILEQREIWGFEGSSLNTHILVEQTGAPSLPVFKSSIDPRFYWKQVEYSETRYYYDPVDGYLLGTRTLGNRRARLEGEQDNEAVKLKAERDFNLPSLSPEEQISTQKEIDLYSVFLNLPIDSLELNTLARHADRYPDVKPPTDPDELADYVEPKYVAAFSRSDISTEVQPDPRSTTADPRPPVTTGKSFREEQAVSIIYPPFGIREKDWIQELEIYSQIQATQNSEGGGLKNSLAITTFADNEGRPGTATRLEIYDDPINITFPGDEEEGSKFLLRSPGVPADARSTDSISFTGVKSSSLGRQVAELDLEIRNTQDAEKWQIKTLANKRYCEGDRLLLEGIEFIVLEVGESRKIEGAGVLSSSGWNLTIGRRIKAPVEMEAR